MATASTASPSPGSFGSRLGDFCRIDEMQTVVARTLRNTTLVATQLKIRDPDSSKTAPLDIEDAFIAAVAFQEGYTRDSWIDGQPMPDQGPQPAGAASLMDLRRVNQARFHTPVDSVQFYFPTKALNAIADANELSRIDGLQSPLSMLSEEPVFAQMGRALIPAFTRPDEASQTFLDHILMASALHLLVRHGGARQVQRRFQGGLAPWQQKRVVDLLEENLDGALSLDDLAGVCQLSPRHFARAFAQSNGMPPYRWMLMRRVERSKELLLSTDLSLAEIAGRTAFANQSHFTRVFTQQVGESPGGWRRVRRA